MSGTARGATAMLPADLLSWTPVLCPTARRMPAPVLPPGTFRVAGSPRVAAIHRKTARISRIRSRQQKGWDYPHPAHSFLYVDDLIRDVGFKPDTPIADGIAKFVEWYKDYYGGK